MEGKQKEDLIESAVLLFREQLAEAMAQMRGADSPETFTEAERRLHSLSQQVASKLTELIVQEKCDDEATRKAARELVEAKAEKRGISMRVERDRESDIRTLGGQFIRVKTPYMSARPRGGNRTTRGAQGTGVYPVLDRLGVAGRSSPALRLQVALAVCEANSVTSAREVLSSGGTEIDHKAALRLTYMVTDDALRARKEAQRMTTSGNDEGEFVGRRVAVAVDGGRVCIRRRVSGRPRKGGRKQFVTEWRESKVLTIYVLDADGERDKSIPPVIDGTLGDADAVFALLRYHLLRLGAHRAEDVTFLGDGAKWIWSRTPKLRDSLGLPTERFVEVVDYYHVVERLTELAGQRARWSEEKREAWVELQKERLLEGEVEAVEAEVLSLLARKKKERETEAAYWSRNRERLRYASRREAKRPIGSGAVESAVRRVVNLRMKGTSIVWTEEHAEGILHLRAYAKSGRWAELEQRVLAQTGWRPTARMVPYEGS